MKLFIYCGVALVLAVFATAAIGYVPTRNRWGEEGVASMVTIAVICVGASVLAVIPLLVLAPRYPEYTGQAVLAATVLRLMLTMAAIVGYQVVADPMMGPFLFWAVVFYLLLLAIETGFGVVAIRRTTSASPPKMEGTDS